MRGVRNYVGTAWPISDEGAIQFSITLYEALLADPAGGTEVSLGQALLKARMQLKEKDATFGALWAAYQHYGDPSFELRTGPAHTMEPTVAKVPMRARKRPAERKAAHARLRARKRVRRR
jgi:hypothetical protein